MNKYAKKVGKLVIVNLLMIIFILTVGCSNSTSNEEKDTSASNTESSSQDTSNESGDTNDWIDVKILKPKADNEVALEEMAVFNVMSEKFKINFIFDNPPTANYAERLNLVMMDTKLPDVIMDMETTDILKYAEDGTIIPLTEYISDMPNLKKAMDERVIIESAITYDDGNIYYLPMLDGKVSGNMPFIIRTDWREQLGIDSPVTIEDWEAYWKMVKETDLNGNGKNDEIGFTSYDLEWFINFSTAWGTVQDFHTSPSEGSKVVYGPITDEFRQALIWMNEMWEAGYIDQELVTTDWSMFSAKIAQNQVGSFVAPLGGGMASFNASMPATIEGFRGDATVPPHGPEGKHIHANIDQVPRKVAAATITADCENVERVVEWLDWMYSEEGVMLLNMGIENETYEMVNGEPVYTEFVLNNPNGLSPKQALGTYTFMGSTGPSVLSSYQTSQMDDASVLLAKENAIIPFIEESNKYILPSALSFTSEQDNIITSKMTNIETYVDEMLLSFITGETSIDEWDNYVAEVEGMEIQAVTDVYQDAYDKLMNK